jgi:hypothetical protein
MTRRPLEELIDTLDPARRLVQEWIAGARNHVEVLPVDQARGADTLLRLQVTSRAVLGAVALETGGILVDHGWLRFLGSGHARVRGTLLTWNGMGERADEHPLSGALVVAYDVVGGFFALNGGAFPGKQGDASYLAPDTLRWEGLAMSYS